MVVNLIQLYQMATAFFVQITGDPSRHPELRTLISKNPHIFGRGRTLEDCSLDEHVSKVTKLRQYGTHAEIKAATSLSQVNIICGQRLP